MAYDFLSSLLNQPSSYSSFNLLMKQVYFSLTFYLSKCFTLNRHLGQSGQEDTLESEIKHNM